MLSADEKTDQKFSLDHDFLFMMIVFPGEDDRPGDRSGGAARQRAEVGVQTQESHRTGKHTQTGSELTEHILS